MVIQAFRVTAEPAGTQEFLEYLATAGYLVQVVTPVLAGIVVSWGFQDILDKTGPQGTAEFLESLVIQVVVAIPEFQDSQVRAVIAGSWVFLDIQVTPVLKVSLDIQVWRE